MLFDTKYIKELGYLINWNRRIFEIFLVTSYNTICLRPNCRSILSRILIIFPIRRKHINNYLPTQVNNVYK